MLFSLSIPQALH